MQKTSNRIGIVVQARITSSRFPNKCLENLCGKPIIYWVIQRLKMAKGISELIIAIPNNHQNKSLEDYLKKLEVEIILGDETDVASRFIQAIKKYNLSDVIRVCADNPLVDYRFIDALIEFYLDNKLDYAFNHIPAHGINLIDGLGAEIFQSSEFISAYKNFNNPLMFEHVTPSFFKQSSIKNIAYKDWMLGNKKLDIDYPHDLEKLSRLISTTYGCDLAPEQINPLLLK